MFLFPHILDLITQVSTQLPADVQKALEKAKDNEEKKSSRIVLEVLKKNISMAQNGNIPLCQDTGFPTFYISYNGNINQNKIAEEITTAMRMATRKGILRPNSVDSLSGKNSGDNSGEIFPKIYFHQDKNIAEQNIKIKLLLKGGGCENVSGQMALPIQTDFGRANRSIDGVEKAILQMVKNAEGKGCAPGIIGVHIGGDRSTGFEQAKKNLFRKLGTINNNSKLKKLEKNIIEKCNSLEIGPMGFGGKTTLLDCFISHSNRLPASFFVTMSYSCWALRRGEIEIDMKKGVIKDKQKNKQKNKQKETETQKQQEKNNTILKKTNSIDFSQAKKLTFPLSDSDVKNVQIGDILLLSGKIYTGRDALHHYIVEENNEIPTDISGSAIYHCGPIMKKNNGTDEWNCISAGPTTSIREEEYEADFIEKTGIKAVIGKGNMGEKTQNALEKNNCVYLHAIGGAAAVYAECIKKIPQVFFLEEFGMPEAMWEMEIEDFPVIVTMK